MKVLKVKLAAVSLAYNFSIKAKSYLAKNSLSR